MLYSVQGQHVNSVYSCFSASEPYGLGVVLILSEANNVIVLSGDTVTHNCSWTSYLIVIVHAVVIFFNMEYRGISEREHDVFVKHIGNNLKNMQGNIECRHSPQKM